VLQVSQRHDGRDRNPGSLDDEPLAGGRFVEHMSEARTDVEGTDRSHGAVMAL
jgi:hypothetical protein